MKRKAKLWRWGSGMESTASESCLAVAKAYNVSRKAGRK